MKLTFLRAVDHAIHGVAGKRVIDRGVVFQQPIQLEKFWPRQSTNSALYSCWTTNGGRPSTILASAAGLIVGFAAVGA